MIDELLDNKKIMKNYILDEELFMNNYFSDRVMLEKIQSSVTSFINTNSIYSNSAESYTFDVDNYTIEHSKRVSVYSCKIANHLQLSSYKVNIIRLASLLHDIGKICVPQEMLNKPDKLNDEEYEIIKLHPVSSKIILEDISGFDLIIDMVYSHHEHYDGSGYPRGLKTDEIPIEAHIIQLSDAYDAMTSDRAYRKALSNETAIKILKEERGKQFHPKVVDAAIDLFSKAV